MDSQPNLAQNLVEPILNFGEGAKTTIEPLSIERIWRAVQERLQAQIGQKQFNAWFGSVKIVEFPDSPETIAITLYFGTPFIRDYVRKNFHHLIETLWREELQAPCHLVYQFEEIKTSKIVDFKSKTPQQNEHGDGVFDMSPQPAGTQRQANNLQTRLSGFTADARGKPIVYENSFDNFIIGKPNEFAFTAARQIASENANFNLLFLHGGVGLGKTHLMHAISQEVLRHTPEARIIYTTAESFMNEFIDALKNRSIQSFKEEYRKVDLLLVDDMQFIIGKNATEEEFFNTFNTLIDKNRKIVISADKSPSDLDGIEERLKSRLNWGITALIHPTNYELRLAILQSKAMKMNVQIEAKILDFLAKNITSNIRELEGAMRTLLLSAEASKHPISLEFAKVQLQHLLRANSRQLTIEDIQTKVAAHFSIRITEMTSPRRTRAVARPRQIAMYFAKKLTDRSLPEIGKKFGGRDHTTVMHAVRTIESMQLADGNFADDLELLEQVLVK